MTETLAQRLSLIGSNPEISERTAATIYEAAAALEAQAAQIAELKSVMIAAAEEISAHWDAYCDAEGYGGPSNLMHRLEQGIPSQYGYTAGRFAELIAERDAQAAQIAERDAQIEALRAALSFYADPSRYHGPNMHLTTRDEWSGRVGLGAYRLDVTRDGGVIARAAMAAKEPR
jgi:hypothetical protein